MFLHVDPHLTLRTTAFFLFIVVPRCSRLAVALVSAAPGHGHEGEWRGSQSVVTVTNIVVLTSVVVSRGSTLGRSQRGGPGCAQMGQSGGYFPFGVEGTLAASAVVFYAYIGFDAVCRLPRR